MKLAKRRKTSIVKVGNIVMGGGNPIVIQSMTNTPTCDIPSTIKQIIELAKAGSQCVRLTINDSKAAKAIETIIKAVRDKGHLTPIIGDFHFNGHLLLSENPHCAKLLDKYRINPGNVGKGTNKDTNFSKIIKIAIENNKPVRIGVNWGSLDQELLTKLMSKNANLKKPKDSKKIIYEAMVQSALLSSDYAQKLGLSKNKIVLSVKMSHLQDMVTVYSLLAERCDYPLHLGLTEAGSHLQGIVASSAALAILLQQGIGDTIRISLTPGANSPRTQEVEICKNLLQSMGLQYFQANVTSCPGCGRTQSDFYNILAESVNKYIQKKMPSWAAQYPGVEKLNIAVMGCIVNGPGESKHADIGISLPGISEEPIAPVYADGRQIALIKGDNIKKDFISILEKYIKNKFS